MSVLPIYMQELVEYGTRTTLNWCMSSCNVWLMDVSNFLKLTICNIISEFLLDLTYHKKEKKEEK